MLYRLQIDIEGKDDACALAQLLREMGYRVELFAHEAQSRLPAAKTRSGTIVLNSMIPNRTYTSEDVAVWLEEHGYKAASANPLLTKLVQEGAIKRIAPGLFRKEIL